MKKTNKSEFINWFIPLLFASIGQKYLFNLFDFKYEDFKLENYEAHPHIKGDVAI